MYNAQLTNIVTSLKKTRKAVVAIGCSFVQGQGAVNDSLYLEYNWIRDRGNVLQIQLSKYDEDILLRQYPSIVRHPATKALDFTMMEYDNSFVHVLCNKYMGGEYTPINLGIRGCGNRASIKELYLHPEIEWDTLDDIIVVYVPSGIERFDFANDTAAEHYNWWCMWPHYQNVSETGKRKLWEGYGTVVYSDKFAVQEQITHAQELMTWCKAHQARLVVTPGFDRRYDRSFFAERLAEVVKRTNNREYVQADRFALPSPSSRWLDLFPWDNMFRPAGNQTFAELMLAQETTLTDRTDHYFQFMDLGSPSGWITACAHPSAKGHELFANLLHQHIATLNNAR
jgi:hypothetical protein